MRSSLQREHFRCDCVSEGCRFRATKCRSVEGGIVARPKSKGEGEFGRARHPPPSSPPHIRRPPPVRQAGRGDFDAAGPRPPRLPARRRGPGGTDGAGGLARRQGQPGQRKYQRVGRDPLSKATEFLSRLPELASRTNAANGRPRRSSTWRWRP